MSRLLCRAGSWRRKSFRRIRSQVLSYLLHDSLKDILCWYFRNRSREWAPTHFEVWRSCWGMLTLGFTAVATYSLGLYEPATYWREWRTHWASPCLAAEHDASGTDFWSWSQMQKLLKRDFFIGSCYGSKHWWWHCCNCWSPCHSRNQSSWAQRKGQVCHYRLPFWWLHLILNVVGRFMVVASDGVWEFLSSEDVVEIVKGCAGDADRVCIIAW